MAFKQFEKFTAGLKTVKPFYTGPRMDIRIVRVAPPKGVFKSTPRGEAKVFLTSEIRSDLYTQLNRQLRISNASFYFELLEGKITTPIKDSMLPSKEWKKFMKFVTLAMKSTSSRSKR